MRQTFNVKGRELSVEVDEDTGNVIVVNAPSVVIHELFHESDGRLARGVDPHGGKTRHVGFVCKALGEISSSFGINMTAQIIYGPHANAWQHGGPTLHVGVPGKGKPEAVATVSHITLLSH